METRSTFGSSTRARQSSVARAKPNRAAASCAFAREGSQSTSSFGRGTSPKTAFTAGNTEELLEAGARAYVNHARGVDVVDEDFIVLSSIYDWYAEDFGGTEESLIEHLAGYADDELAAFLKGFEGTIGYDYDWSLNRPRP